MKVLIYSIEHRAWWRPQECGYTTYKSLAGEYDLERAIEICNNANKHIQFDKHYPNEQDHAVQPNELIFPIYDQLIDATDKCKIEWVEDGVLGCTYKHKDNELCLDMICKDCRLYKCTCYQ